MQGGPGSVRLRFRGGTVRAVPVFSSGGSSRELQRIAPGAGISVQFDTEARFREVSVPKKRSLAVPVPRSVP